MSVRNFVNKFKILTAWLRRPKHFMKDEHLKKIGQLNFEQILLLHSNLKTQWVTCKSLIYHKTDWSFTNLFVRLAIGGG